MSDEGQGAPPREEIEAVLGKGADGMMAAWRRRMWPAILLLLFLGGMAAYLLLGDGGASDRVRYRTDPAKLGDITVIVTATGTVQPTNTVEISSELSGIIRTVAVDYNSEVKAGQTLAELDTDKLRATVDSSRARVNAAKARVAEAEATVIEKKQDLARKQALAERQIVSVQDLDIAHAAYERAVATLASAKADVEAAQADLKLNETNLAKTCICSPINGVVLNRNVEPGQVVAASLQAPILFMIAEDLRKMEVQVDVDEADVGKVKEGQSATFTVDAYPDHTFQAQITQLRFGSEVVQGVVTYKAVLTADNDELLLRPGMTATAEIRVQEEKNVLTVSNEALRFTPPAPASTRDRRSLLRMLIPGRPQFRQASRPPAAGPRRKIWLLRDGVAEAVEVTARVSDGQRTQIADGPVTAGEEIIVDVLTAPN